MKLLIITITLLLISITFVSAGKVNYYTNQNFYLMCTPSMIPTFSCYNKLTFQTVSELKVNEIYFYRPNYRDFPTSADYIIHRLKDKQNGMCLFKGDNNDFFDPWVKCNQVAFVLVDIK